MTKNTTNPTPTYKVGDSIPASFVTLRKIERLAAMWDARKVRTYR